MKKKVNAHYSTGLFMYLYVVRDVKKEREKIYKKV
jgi:hypothetical protein